MIRIGTSGWSYDSWTDRFYGGNPEGRHLLELYAETFDTVEINNTFYNLPSQKSVLHWAELTDDNFLFAVKASRYITHMKKLKYPEQTTGRFFAAIEPLGEKIGPILFQLPPRWNIDVERLEGFLRHLPEGYRYTFEFRDKSWLTEEIYDLLRRYNVALCVYHLAGFLSPEVFTADFTYLRLHGPGGKYKGSYDDKTLTTYAEKFADWAAGGRDVYCYFDNDEKSYAARDARTLLAKLSGYKVYPAAPAIDNSARTGR